MPPAIAVSDVSKRFRLYHERYQSLKERVIHFGRVPYDEFWALRDVDVEIQHGETFGVLGRNGSGKSTLLKCMAGIMRPTTGSIEISGRVAALLELGAGFHSDLTGRENVFLNGSILGMSHRDIERRFDEIVAFAELEAFIDNQVKFYSSGMYVRLGFAVAVNVDPDILVVDEVLAVGDEAFQRKCLDRVRAFQREGRTIVLVTHDADRVREICDRSMVLDGGRVVTLGTPGEAIRGLREHLYLPVPEEAPAPELEPSAETVAPRGPRPNRRIRITDVAMWYPNADERPYLLPGERLTITVSYESDERLSDVVFGIAIYDGEGRELFGTNTDLLGHQPATVTGSGEVVFDIAAVHLLDGTYPVTFGIVSRDGGQTYEWREQEHRFEVMNPSRTPGIVALPVSIEVRNESHLRAAGGAG